MSITRSFNKHTNTTYAYETSYVWDEMYIYDDGNGPFGPDDGGTTSGAWRENLFRWMQTNNIATGRKVSMSPFARRPAPAKQLPE